MDASKLPAWWFHRQGLDGSFQGSSASEALQKAGWARSVGGSGPYISLFARLGLSREAIDQAVANLDIHELPSARGCTYVVPASDFALALTLSQEFSGSDMKVAAKLGVTEKEVDKLCEAVVRVLGRGPLEPEQIREATGKASRSLGEEGKRRGLTTTLPLALGKLQTTGEIRRLPVNGRLDQQRYSYALWRPNPLARSTLSREEAHIELARRYFRWIGPASLSEFQWFSGLGVKACKAAVEPLQLVAPEPGSDRLMFSDDREVLAKFAASKTPQYALVSALDSMVLLRRDLSQLLPIKASKQQVYAEKGYKEIGMLADLPSNAILDRGDIVGLWEYDPEAATVAWMPFVSQTGMKKSIAQMEAFIRQQLGDARSFSLDSPKSRTPRIAALRKAHSAH